MAAAPSQFAAPQPAPFIGPRLAFISVALALGTFMTVLDSTIANVSLPTIAGNLGVSSDTSTWIITAFAVSNGIALPLTGWLMPAAQSLRRADGLADIVVEELRRRRILLPARGALEAIIHVAIRRGIRIGHRALAGGLSEQQKLDLEKLLDPREGTSATILAWARTPALSPPCRGEASFLARGSDSCGQRTA